MADDREIFAAALKVNAIIMSKDSDFLKLIDQFGAPSSFIWITCGNTSNQKMRDVLLITKNMDFRVQGVVTWVIRQTA